MFINLVSHAIDFTIKASLFTINLLSALYDIVPKRQLYPLAGVKAFSRFYCPDATVEDKNISIMVRDFRV